MSLAGISRGASVFLDANIFVYAFSPNLQFGPECIDLLDRIEHQELNGYTSSQVVSDVAHRLMTFEACAAYGWPYAGIAGRMQKHPNDIQKLTRFRTAIETISIIGVEVLPVYGRHVETAAAISQQYGLLSNDALIVAMMHEYGLAVLASHDKDLDRVQGITRFAPV